MSTMPRYCSDVKGFSVLISPVLCRRYQIRSLVTRGAENDKKSNSGGTRRGRDLICDK